MGLGKFVGAGLLLEDTASVRNKEEKVLIRQISKMRLSEKAGAEQCRSTAYVKAFIKEETYGYAWMILEGHTRNWEQG